MPMVVAFVLGTLLALVVGVGLPAALLGGVAGVILMFVAPIPVGLLSMQKG